MSLPLATCLLILAAIFTNRVVAMGFGLWFHEPVALLFALLLLIDAVQIPFYYRLYEHGFSLFDGVPAVKKWFNRDWSQSVLGRWAKPLGGFGVMLVAAMPTFGGGIWSSAFVAYGLGLKRQAGYAWMMAGSIVSYVTLYWILDTLIRTVRYFVH